MRVQDCCTEVLRVIQYSCVLLWITTYKLDIILDLERSKSVRIWIDMYTEGHRNLEKINKLEAYTSYINSHCIYKRYTLYFFCKHRNRKEAVWGHVWTKLFSHSKIGHMPSLQAGLRGWLIQNLPSCIPLIYSCLFDVCESCTIHTLYYILSLRYLSAWIRHKEQVKICLFVRAAPQCCPLLCQLFHLL